MEDLTRYTEIFSNKETMTLYLGGPWSQEKTAKRLEGWVNRWKQHLFSALSISDKKTQNVIGHVVLGHGDYEGDVEKGWSEVALVLDSNHWKDKSAKVSGMGTEVAHMIAVYAQKLFERNELVPVDVTEEQRPEVDELFKEGKIKKVLRNKEDQITAVFIPFTYVRATADKENIAGHKILSHMANQYKGTIEPSKKNANRDLFTFDVSQVQTFSNLTSMGTA